MTLLTEKIYYADQNILKLIESQFELIDCRNWYRLYRNKLDNSFWRLDEVDKYQEQFFVRLESSENWTEYDDQSLRIELLKKHRGTSSKKCTWEGCDKNALNEMLICEFHAFKEMGVRK
ncbi:hypothetical protein E7Z59_07165 [Robertkochia marina]|uniref:Uncharacterized protein n=1 Tax=Robertkochia marina TaxID=1227945 RepID=A0A4S3M1U2_9FLAO|nr:hypothetical protein [Robertkochia marina]THD67435.1 hypothetical protein E7Z59_07165 [Robertkochia marina]TRZ40779.1 hypothetical protein D3A96_15365 [Robertkochia marina]